MSSTSSTSGITLSGLVSGVDTESVVTKLMKGEQAKLDALEQQKQILEWKKDYYRDINSKLLAVRNTLTDLKLPSTYLGKKVTSSDEKTVTATAKSDAVAGLYTMKVKQVAQRVSLTSTAALGSSGDNSSIAKQFNLASDAKIKFTLKGKNGEIAFDFEAGKAKMKDLVDGINSKGTGFHAFYDSGVDRFFLTSDDFGKNAEISVQSDSMDGTKSFLNDVLKLNLDYSSLNAGGPPATTHEISSSSMIAATAPKATDLISSLYSSSESVPSTIKFTLQGTTATAYNFSFNPATTTMEGLVNGINAQTASTGITAAYDATNGKLSLSSAGQIAIRSDDNGFLGDKLKLSMDKNTGTSAKIDFNDATDLEFDSNNFTLNNINFSINPSAAVGTTATLTVANDNTTAVTKIKAFVEAYNSAVSTIATKLKESRTIEKHEVKYMPLTDAQKKEMTDDQIKAWEANAKLGLMKNESILRSTLSDLRSITGSVLADKVPDANISDKEDLVDYVDASGKKISNCKYLSLASIGITTGKYTTKSTENNKLFIDEAALTKALQDNPESIQKLFTLTQTDKTKTTTEIINGTSYTRTLNYNVGIAAKLYEGLTENMAKITDKAGSDTSSYDNSLLAKDIYRLEDRIDIQEDRMDDLQKRYYSQFTNMETVLAKLNSQASWLQNQFSSK